MTTKTISVKVDSGNSTQTVDKLDSSMKKLGASTNKAVDEIGELNAVSKGVKTGLGTLNSSVDATNKKLGGLSRNAGQAGIQIQQFVGQVQGGQDVFQAFSAQAADIGIVLGAPLVGAVVGLAAALGGALLPALFESSGGVEELREELEKLIETTTLTAAQAQVLIDAERDTIKENKKRREEIQKEIDSLRSRLTLSESVIQNYKQESKEFKNLTQGQESLTRALNEQIATLELLDSKTDEANDKIKLYSSLVGGEAVTQTKNQSDAIEVLIEGLRSEVDLYGKSREQIALRTAAMLNATPAQLETIKNLAAERRELERLNQERENQARVEQAINVESLKTEQLKAEIAIRRQLAAGEIDQQTANAEIALQNLLFGFEARREAILQNEITTAEQKAALIASLNDQEVAAQEALQLRLTQAAKKGAEERKAIQEFGSQQILGGLSKFANAYANIESKNQKKTNKIRKIAVIADTAAGIQRSLAINPYDWFNPAAIALSGAAQLKAIGSSTSISSQSGAPAAPPIAPQPQQNQQTRIIDLRGLEGDQTISFNRNQLIDLLQNDDDVILAANNGQQQGQRVGLINAD
tara:strand:- start:936 stop:2687 length:1752 start_codon:yes stop_codon:yes gene_type:complete